MCEVFLENIPIVLVKKNGKTFLLISQKWWILWQLHWSKGVINSFKGLKWGIVRLCKSNSSWDMTKNMKKENVKNPQFCKKNCQILQKSGHPFFRITQKR